MTPYYSDSHVTIYHGDCREVLPSLGEKNAVVVTDPPYGQTSLVWDQWCEGWLSALPAEWSSMWCFGTLRMFMDRADDFCSGGWRLSQDVIWEKHNGSGFAADRFKRVHEQPAHFYRGRWDLVVKCPVRVEHSGPRKTVRYRGPTPHTGRIGDTGYVDDGHRMMRSVIRVRSAHGYAEHPTQKPAGILTPLIAYSVPEIGGRVVDPFCGSGSHLIAAAQYGAVAVGIEIDERNCEIAARRAAGGRLFQCQSDAPALTADAVRQSVDEH